jgi:Ser/Thr protein kinase RdoA (MazF antagonist)
VASADQVRTVLRTSWQRVVSECEPLSGAMNSSAWLVVTAAGERLVAKAVPAGQRSLFEAGLAAAARLDAAGIPAGAPVRATDGAMTVVTGHDSRTEAVALLRFVPGQPLAGRDPVDQRWWGDTLGVAHRVLAGFSDPRLVRFHWVRPDAPHLSVEPWVRPAVAAAVGAVNRLCVTDELTYGALHGDPDPGSFRLDVATGRIGLIDWGAAGSGPLMYDVASAVMYAGGPAAATDLLEAYLAAGPVPREELEATLPTMLRFRWAVQADYFAYRLSVDDRTGIRDPAENRKGLYDARDALADLDPELG